MNEKLHRLCVCPMSACEARHITHGSRLIAQSSQLTAHSSQLTAHSTLPNPPPLTHPHTPHIHSRAHTCTYARTRTCTHMHTHSSTQSLLAPHHQLKNYGALWPQALHHPCRECSCCMLWRVFATTLRMHTRTRKRRSHRSTHTSASPRRRGLRAGARSDDLAPPRRDSRCQRT